MKTNFKFRMSAAFLAMILAVSLASCSEEKTPDETENHTLTSTVETAANETDPPIDTEEIGEWEDMMNEAEMIDVVKSWAGFSYRGVLDTPDSCETVKITKKSDLDPYREFLPQLTPEDEDAIFADEKGYCILIEITAKNEQCYYSISSIFNTGMNIDVLVSEFVEEDPEAGKQPEHSFFLFYFPSEIYHNEDVKVLFINA